MTIDNLTDLTLKWLEKNQSDYITFPSTKPAFVNGGCLTDLRAFMNYCKTLPDEPYVFYQDIVHDYAEYLEKNFNIKFIIK